MSEKNLDTVIIGSGPGGYVAAIRAAQLGQHVTIIEKDKLGGTCLNSGCIPSKSLITIAKKWADYKKHQQIFNSLDDSNKINIEELQKYKNKTITKLQRGISHLLEKNRINIINGEAMFTSDSSLSVNENGVTSTYTFNHCIIATGSEPRELPNFPWGNKILSSSHVLNLHSLPEEIVILGGGYIGIELGCAYANLGVKVTIIEEQEDILLLADSDIRKVLKQQLKKKNIKLLTSAIATEYLEEGQKVTIKVQTKDSTLQINADYLIVSAGRIPCTYSLGLHNTNIDLTENGFIDVNPSMKTSIPSIFAIGDVVKGPALAHKASYEGKLAAEVISGHHYSVDYKAIPLIIFSDPEIALTGQTESNDTTQEYTFPMGANGRALTLNQPEGFIKMFCHNETRQIKGAAIIAPNASEIISEITVAIEAGWTVDDLSLVIHPHPTISEAIMEASELAAGLPIHVPSM
ncbi:dihydrolipoyl dehydrogenase [Bacillus sp. EB106-08-02-XG196]|uniref:dihydrolipoyl dehydrogenase n=1 Tax=Bacillus sp. EB106-08-02-XG196 TaxID=2737049 RepID=UPI0015C4C0EC|nr:dihydrolipoyl dehydrogenase [Bacillus sp. EB106-08-02-XG196]NWQ43735.1 dihydrolipoyl dehydrogenase [Bacillus sp. EB106-08-02-XG196]